MIGAATNMVQPISTSICTCVTSLVMRVISDGAPSSLISLAEYPVTWWNRAWRTSRPNPIAARAPKNTPAIANSTWTRLTASMMPPWDQM